LSNEVELAPDLNETLRTIQRHLEQQDRVHQESISDLKTRLEHIEKKLSEMD
jgi:hypothetical protein